MGQIDEMTGLFSGFRKSMPTLPHSAHPKKVQYRNYWVQEAAHSLPIPASVRFASGTPEGVLILGVQGSYFPTMIFSWGPQLMYVEPDASFDSAVMAHARNRVFEGQDDKDNFCPICEQRVKLYRRKLHTEMALFLIKLVKAYQKEPRWYSTRELLPATSKAATDGAYLTRWGLVEKMPSMNSAGGKAGMYQPTLKGIEFAQGKTTVPSHVHIICGKTAGFSETPVFIENCLCKKFNYAELMFG